MVAKSTAGRGTNIEEAIKGLQEVAEGGRPRAKYVELPEAATIEEVLLQLIEDSDLEEVQMVLGMIAEERAPFVYEKLADAGPEVE